MPKFRKKPVVIEAVQMEAPFEVETREGVMRGNAGDWLITGVEGEKYPCADSIFRKTYEAIPDGEVESETPILSDTQHAALKAIAEHHYDGGVFPKMDRTTLKFLLRSGLVESHSPTNASLVLTEAGLELSRSLGFLE